MKHFLKELIENWLLVPKMLECRIAGRGLPIGIRDVKLKKINTKHAIKLGLILKMCIKFIYTSYTIGRKQSMISTTPTE